MALSSLDVISEQILSLIKVGKHNNSEIAIKNYNRLSDQLNSLQDVIKQALEQDNLNLIAADVSTLTTDNLLVYYIAAAQNMLLLSSAIHYFRRCRFFDGQSCSQFVCDCVCDCVCSDCGGYCYTCQQYTPCDCDCDCDSCGDCDCDCDSCGDYCDCFAGCSDCVACDDCDCFCDCDSECDCVGCDF